MTLSANWNQAEHMVVRCTYGPTTFEVVEDKNGARAFWSSLGRLLAQDRAHVEMQAELAYSRYRDHAEGKSVHGEPLPSWADLGMQEGGSAVREHWIAALGG